MKGFLVSGEPNNDEREALDKAIWWAVLEECCAHKGGEPHAADWNRDGYRKEATLCGRCARLIETLQALPGFRRQGPITDAQVRAALTAYYSVNGAWVSEKDYWIDEFVSNMRAALEAAERAR